MAHIKQTACSPDGVMGSEGRPDGTETETDWDWDWDWDKFIQHNMTLYRCMISDIHDSSYVLFSTNLISITNLHVGRPLLRRFLVANAEAELFEMNVKIVSSYLQARKSFDPLQRDW